MKIGTLEQIPKEQLPRHIGIIMDGNGRWAAKRGLPRTAGHKKGAEVFQKITEHCHKIGISHLTVYAFSTENWKRPQSEIDTIMGLLRRYLDDGFSRDNQKAQVHFLGDHSQLAPDIQQKIAQVEQSSAQNTQITVNVALNYGGRDEIISAARFLAKECAAGTLAPEQITEALLSERLYTAGQPDPDLIIRPSGEFRTSNFLVWQSAYAELVFMDVLWPDFTAAHLEQAILEYAGRSRRFGGI